MNTAQLWNNIIAYALQVGLLVGVGALAPPLLRIRTPRARLLFWQTLLAACLILPWVQPWRQEVINATSETLPAVQAPVSALAPASRNAVTVSLRRPYSFAEIILWLLAAGIAIRLVWLAVGLIRLAGYRRRGQTLQSDPVFRIATATSARWLVSDEIASPVTFGWRDPVVLLPARFPDLRGELRDAILCHELVHVERRDWLFTFAEEIVRAAFWFHPAIWWVLGEIQLAREQTVDQTVVEITNARGSYVDALLAMASPVPESNHLDLAPAPLFLRRRHFRRRVLELVQEVRMRRLSKMRLIFSQAAALTAIAGVAWVVSEALPLAAAPQRITDATGVSVNAGNAKLVYRTPISYPAEALLRGVEGRIIVEATIGADGQLSDETVVRCPRELCQAAVDSLPNWQFDATQANTKRSLSIDFVNPIYAQASFPAAPGINTNAAPRSVPTFVARTIWMDGAYVNTLQPTISSALGHALDGIRIAGLSEGAANQLRSRLPVKAGATWTAAAAAVVRQIVNDFDSNLEIELVNNFDPQRWSLWIGPAFNPAQQPLITPAPLPADVYQAGNGVTPPAVIMKYDPVYTDGAKKAGLSGSVTVSMVVGADGLARNVQVIGSLDPGLDRAATDALARWRFRPGSKDGAPVSVQTQVIFSFRLL